MKKIWKKILKNFYNKPQVCNELYNGNMFLQKRKY